MHSNPGQDLKTGFATDTRTLIECCNAVLQIGSRPPTDATNAKVEPASPVTLKPAKAESDASDSTPGQYCCLLPAQLALHPAAHPNLQ